MFKAGDFSRSTIAQLVQAKCEKALDEIIGVDNP